MSIIVAPSDQIITHRITSNMGSVNLYFYLGIWGYMDTDLLAKKRRTILRLIVDPGVQIGSLSDGSQSVMDAITLLLINHGQVLGPGGDGGASATSGDAGGDAITLSHMPAFIKNYGIIGGGGGGGGGGGFAGGGGGAGYPNGLGDSDGGGDGSYLAGGGGQGPCYAFPCNGGSGGDASGATPGAGGGASGTGGAGGSGGAPGSNGGNGSGGTSGGGGGFYSSGAGGGGGGLGGAGGSGSSSTAPPPGGAGGGAAGAAINSSGLASVLVTGTIYGSVS
jgi:hypothetical protein